MIWKKPTPERKEEEDNNKCKDTQGKSGFL
jgi:hypothetical protein